MERVAKLILSVLMVILAVIGLALLLVWYYGLGPRTEPIIDEAAPLSAAERQAILESLGPVATSSPFFRVAPSGETEVTPAGQAVWESLGAK